jgi:hypothetical protein
MRSYIKSKSKLLWSSHIWVFLHNIFWVLSMTVISFTLITLIAIIIRIITSKPKNPSWFVLLPSIDRFSVETPVKFLQFNFRLWKIQTVYGIVLFIQTYTPLVWCGLPCTPIMWCGLPCTPIMWCGLPQRILPSPRACASHFTSTAPSI